MKLLRIRALRGPNLWSQHTSIEATIFCSGSENNITAIQNAIESIKQFIRDTKCANVEIENLKKYFPSLEKITLEISSNDEKVFDCFHRLISLLKENIRHSNFFR